MISMTMMSLADHIVGVANESRIGVTQLHLQKTLYFTLLKAFNEGLISKANLEEIYDEPFEAWDYGPVVRSVYDKYKVFNSSNITIEAEPNEEFNDLNDIILELLNESISSLVRRSHEHPFWSESYREGNIKRFDNPEYDIEDLEESAEYEFG